VNATPPPDPRSVHLVDGRNDWAQPWFAEALIQGLLADGLDDAGVAAVQTAFATARPGSLEALHAAVEAMAPMERGNAVERVAALQATAAFNRSCYARTTAETQRTVAWPNNQRTRVSDPDFYFDIFEDLPYRETFRFIERTTPIGSAGSCFALRIAHQLQAWGYNYVIEEDDLPPDVPLDRLSTTAYRMAPARWGTLFNAPSMRQMVERAFGLWQPEPIVVQQGSRFIDPFRSIRALYADVDGYLVDYERHNQALRRALMSCEVFILTLGLTEAWRFAHSGDFTSIAPAHIDPALVRPHELTVAENVSELERLYEVYARHRPGIKLVISVSPVPLNKTFSQRSHVVAANALSKATLRVAAEEFCRNHPRDVFYFPSYEVVTSGTRNAWEADMRHVSAEAVSRVMTLFRTMFLADQSSLLAPLWHEEPQEHHSAVQQARGVARLVARRLGLKR
jgi:hypothetical protein